MTNAEHAGETSPFGPLDELLAQGVISKEEHAQQSRILALDIVRLNRTNMKRNRPTGQAIYQPPTLPLPRMEIQMNTKNLLETMQLNNRIMAEQFKTLGSLTRQTPPHTVRGGDSAENTAELLNHLTNAHLGNAAQSIQALAGAAARARDEWNREQRDGQGGPAHHGTDAAMVIDVEVVEVKGDTPAAPPPGNATS